MRWTVRWRCGPASGWTVMMSAPASAKASRNGSTGEIIRWTSNGLARVRAQRLHHRRADREVGHEMAVHHVDVDPVGAGRVDRAHFLAQPGEVGGQDRRGDERVGPWRRLDAISAAADKARDEEAVEAAFGFEHAGQDAQPARSIGVTPSAQFAVGGSSAKSGVSARKASITLLAFLRLERADRIDQACRRASASRRRGASSSRLAARRFAR